jgi:DNA-binding NarL/FixJ family response regulator
MDIHMHTMDGLASTGYIRELHPEARMVMATDYDDEDLSKQHQKREHAAAR